MKYTVKPRHIWKHKADNKYVGRVIDIKNGDSIDNYEEVEFPEPMKKLVDKIREWKNKNNK